MPAYHNYRTVEGGERKVKGESQKNIFPSSIIILNSQLSMFYYIFIASQLKKLDEISSSVIVMQGYMPQT